MVLVQDDNQVDFNYKILVNFIELYKDERKSKEDFRNDEKTWTVVYSNYEDPQIVSKEDKTRTDMENFVDV